MALYLLLRPYGDTRSDADLAAAVASTRWLVAHLCGMLALASAGRLALRIHDLDPRPLTAAARWTGLAGVVLVLPYYGAEAFALHVIGGSVPDPTTAADLVTQVRGQGLAMTMFGLGLALIAVAAVLIGLWWLRWVRGSATTSRLLVVAPWPWVILTACVLPQFYLPPAGRIAFGVVYLVAALGFLAAVHRVGALPVAGQRARTTA
ncbi:hypothetical protein [Nocardioides sp.]|uniref:hypothetical protein n=1 Tax=Nocardioides sp. TaxID=35761 RepID=UPI002607F8FF|nr:hypothetical protein [Nocardioides sp.]